jgi:hypothetical protein
MGIALFDRLDQAGTEQIARHFAGHDANGEISG